MENLSFYRTKFNVSEFFNRKVSDNRAVPALNAFICYRLFRSAQKRIRLNTIPILFSETIP